MILALKNLITLLKTLSLAHFTPHIHSSHFDQLHSLLAGLNIKFNVLGVTKTRFNFNPMPTSTFELEGCVIEHTH